MESGGFGEGEKELDVVVAVFEFAVWEGEYRGKGASVRVGGLNGRVVEADKCGRCVVGCGGHGGGG